jgi:hypothetical protein
MKRFFTHATITLSALLFSIQSHALLISSEGSFNENNQVTFEYDFSANLIDVQAFDIYFAFDLFDNISVDSVNDSLDVIDLPSNPDFFEDAIVSFVVLDNALSLGNTLESFAISADYIGTAPIESLSSLTQFYDIVDDNFDIVDPNDFGVIVPADYGQTVAPITKVNAPTSVLFLLLGFGALVFASRVNKGAN